LREGVHCESLPTRIEAKFHNEENIMAKKTIMETIETFVMGDTSPAEAKTKKSKTVKKKVAKETKAKSVKKAKAKKVKNKKAKKKR
jgi:hypothetical protein